MKIITYYDYDEYDGNDDEDINDNDDNSNDDNNNKTTNDNSILVRYPMTGLQISKNIVECHALYNVIFLRLWNGTLNLNFLNFR